MTDPIIALDADGVLLDYHASYRLAWQQAFGHLPELRDPQAYWPMDRWHVQRLEGERLETFRACFDEDFWSSISPLPGALDACRLLSEAGYRLVCVSALKPRFQATRLRNLRDHGFPIEVVIATSADTTTGLSPKSAVLKELRPVAFVDDFLPYFRGIPPEIHAALVTREPNGSPNTGEDLALVHSRHTTLADFAAWWLQSQPLPR